MPLLSLTDKAWRRGIVRTDPFGEYSLEMQETDRGYLTEEELRTLLTPCSSRNRPTSCGTCSSSGVSPGLATLT